MLLMQCHLTKSKAGCAVVQAPMDNFAAVCLLGDLFPTEWPPAGGLRRGTTYHPAPTEMRNRAAFARSIEPATDLFRQLIREAATSESRVMRCALVRLCARASGVPDSVPVAKLFISPPASS